MQAHTRTRQCWHLIKHATTPHERKTVEADLKAAREAGDSNAITWCLAKLSPCE